MNAYDLYRNFYYLMKTEDLLDNERKKFFRNENRINHLYKCIEVKEKELKNINIKER